MPTYDYICENCGYEFEQFQAITASSLRKCPECGKKSLKRLIGAGAGVIFKGSGFYQTDYRSDNYKKSEKSEKPVSDSSTAKKEIAAKAEDVKPGGKTGEGKKTKKKTA